MDFPEKNHPEIETQPEEKQPWSTPALKKMDIQETAVFGQNNEDGDGMS